MKDNGEGTGHFTGKLGSYKILKTEDNSDTIFSEYFDEACHNLSGAYAETLHNYIQGCYISDLFSQDEDFAVLDVGFGVGVGLKALLDERENHPDYGRHLSYFSIELDEELFLWSVKSTLKKLTFIRKKSADLLYFEATHEAFTLRIFIGDGRVTLPRALSLGLLKPLNAIFQDAFSPKKNPALWSVEWFTFLKELSFPKVHLSTYSSSISIRKSLLAAGWSIQNARGFAMKRTMTKANLMGETEKELLDQLERSPSVAIVDVS